MSECPKSPTKEHEWSQETPSFPSRCKWCGNPKVGEAAIIPSQLELPKTTYMGKEFYVDERLGQIRKVENPHEFYDIGVLEQQGQEDLAREMARMLYGGTEGLPVLNTLRAGLYAAYTTIDSADGRRVFIQDLAASFNRQGSLANESVDRFQELGYKFMEAEE